MLSNGDLGDDGSGRAIAIDPGDSDIVYGARDGEGIFKSVDGGTSWTPVNDGLGSFSIFALAVDPQNTSVLYAGTSSGVFKSANGGARWEAASVGLESSEDLAIHALAIDPIEADTVYAATEGGIFKSITAAEIWDRLANGLPDDPFLSVAIDPANRHRVYAGSETAGVFESVDFGASWQAAGTGLPSLKVVGLTVVAGDPALVHAAVAGLGVASLEVVAVVPTPPATQTPTPQPTPTREPIECAGDCDGNGIVAINELVLAVNINLGRSDISACPAIDTNGDGTAAINELIAAVNRNLDGC
jgi:hypothetical protein